MYIREFLYVKAREAAPTYHVVLARDFTDIEGNPQTEASKPLTPAQAETMGFPLSRLIAEIDGIAIKEVGELRAYKLRREEEDSDSAAAAVAVSEAVVEEKKSLLNIVSFGLLDKPQ